MATHTAGADTTRADTAATSVLRLRPLVVDDADAMATVLADESLYEFTGGEPPTRDELARRYAIQVRGHSGDGTEQWINAVVTLGSGSDPIGYVQATIPVNGDPTEIAWVIGRPWQGNGYAGRATRLLLEDLAEQGVTAVVAHIHPEHEASRRTATRLGMTATRVIVDAETRWEGTTAHR